MEGMSLMNKLEVLYEDNHIIVVVKPKNILSQEDSTGDIDILTMVKEYVKEKYQKPGNVYIGLIHRLDRPVGGIMVFAKTSKAASRLSEQIRTNKMEKKYLAVINGILLKETDTWIDYLKRCENGNAIVTNSEDGKYSELSYEVIKKEEVRNLSLVSISLKTGRHHQIRVQFASRGYPLYGDFRYGKKEEGGLALYAYSLSFYHPTTKEKLTFSSFPKKEGGFEYFS